MNFSGTYFTPSCFEIFDAILCSHVSFLFLLVFALPSMGQGALLAGFVPVHSDIHVDEILR
jgi:hypothetical protein